MKLPEGVLGNLLATGDCWALWATRADSWRCCLCCRSRVLWGYVIGGLSQEELIRTRDGTAPPQCASSTVKGWRLSCQLTKEKYLQSRYQRSHSSVNPGTKGNTLIMTTVQPFGLTQLPYTLFYTYELVYNSETTLPNEIQLSLQVKMFSSSSPNETHTMIHCHCNHHWVILITCKILSRPIEYFVTDKLNHKVNFQKHVFEIKRRRKLKKIVSIYK